MLDFLRGVQAVVTLVADAAAGANRRDDWDRLGGGVARVDNVALAPTAGMIGGRWSSGGAAALPLVNLFFIEAEHGQVGARPRHVASPAAAG